MNPGSPPWMPDNFSIKLKIKPLDWYFKFNWKNKKTVLFRISSCKSSSQYFFNRAVPLNWRSCQKESVNWLLQVIVSPQWVRETSQVRFGKHWEATPSTALQLTHTDPSVQLSSSIATCLLPTSYEWKKFHTSLNRFWLIIT